MFTRIEDIDLSIIPFATDKLRYLDDRELTIGDTRIGSVPLSMVVGTTHCDYAEKSWGELKPVPGSLHGNICDVNVASQPLKRAVANVQALERNPEYYLSTNEKEHWSFYKIGDDYFISTGNNRTIVARYFLHANDLPAIVHGVRVTNAIAPPNDSAATERTTHSWLRALKGLFGSQVRPSLLYTARLLNHVINNAVGLQDNPFVLSLAFAVPTMIIGDGAYVGGMAVHRYGGKIADFLMATASTGNLAVVEIKTPSTPLLANSHYRTGIFAPSSDLSGALAQALDQRAQLQSEWMTLCLKSGLNDKHGYAITGVILIGSTPMERDQKKSLDLIRNAVSGIAIVTFDELLQRLKEVLSALSPAPKVPLEGDVPF